MDNAAAKANRTCGFIRRTVIKSSFEAKIAACKPLECPKMEYSISTTDPHTLLLIYKLERVQHYFVHWGTRERNGMATVTEMLAKLGWETLKVIKSTKRLAIFYKMLNSLIGHSDNPTFIFNPLILYLQGCLGGLSLSNVMLLIAQSH